MSMTKAERFRRGQEAAYDAALEVEFAESHAERLARLKKQKPRCGCMELAVVWTASEQALCARCANRRVMA